MSNLYQDAILDAKALRASAMANAKAALEEAFEPKIKELMRLKLTEELDELSDLEEAEIEENVDEMYHDKVEETYHEDGVSEDINEAELEEILAQLEELSGHGNEEPMEEEKEIEQESLNEAEGDDDDGDDDDKTEEDDDNEEDETEEGVTDETKVVEITVGELKQILQSVNQETMPVQDMGGDTSSDDSEAESEISLEEILAELEEEEGYADVSSSPGYQSGKQIPQPSEEKDTMEEELEEAKSTIETLRQNLQEVNLLNAKYLYMNKLFKNKTLSESQKVKVINALDRAVSVKEVKNTYETLKESFEPKKQLKESIGFASQSAGVAPKKPIIEQDNMLNRWQKLAGIK